MSNLLEKASEKVVEIQKAMRDTEQLERMLNNVEGKEVAVYGDSETVLLSSVLSIEQMEHLHNAVVDIIQNSYTDSMNRLQVLIGEKKEEKADVKARNIKATNIEIKGMEFSIDELVRLYVDEHKTIEQLAKMCKKSKQTIGDILKEQGVVRPRGSHMIEKAKAKEKKVNELDVATVKEMYLNKGLSMADIAKEFGCKKADVHNLCKDNNISRPSNNSCWND